MPVRLPLKTISSGIIQNPNVLFKEKNRDDEHAWRNHCVHELYFLQYAPEDYLYGTLLRFE